MKFYFLRHANALDGIDDEIRPLSSRGQREAEAIGNFLKKAQIRFDLAYSSPLTRACETARMVLATCRCSESILQTDDALQNETPQDVFDGWLRSFKAKNILFVGHAPILAARARKLLTIENSEALALPTGGLVCLETLSGQKAKLIFFISPSILGVEL